MFKLIRIRKISRSWTELTGYTLEDKAVIQTWLTRAYGFGGEAVRDAMEQAFAPQADEPMRAVVFDITTRQGERRTWSFSASVPGTLRDGRRFVLGMSEDITERKRAEEALREYDVWLAGQREAMEAALHDAPLETSLGVLVRTATDALGQSTRAAFYLADDEGALLHHVVGIGADYAEAVKGFQIGPESLACGLATYTGKPVLTTDVMTDPRWEKWRWLAERFDYRGCWSFPIHSAARKFVGTLALYWQQPREATQRELELVALLTHTAAIIISQFHEMENRKRAEAALRASEERLDRMSDLPD